MGRELEDIEPGDDDVVSAIENAWAKYDALQTAYEGAREAAVVAEAAAERAVAERDRAGDAAWAALNEHTRLVDAQFTSGPVPA